MNSRNFALEMAIGRYIENRWSAIYRGQFGLFTRNLYRGCKITCRHGLRDQKSNFRQFNMAAAAMLKIVFGV